MKRISITIAVVFTLMLSVINANSINIDASGNQVSTWDELITVVEGSDSKDVSVVISNDLDADETLKLNGVNLSIIADKNITITRSGDGSGYSLFDINEGSVLTIGNKDNMISFTDHQPRKNSSALFDVNGSTLKLNNIEIYGIKVGYSGNTTQKCGILSNSDSYIYLDGILFHDNVGGGGTLLEANTQTYLEAKNITAYDNNSYGKSGWGGVINARRITALIEDSEFYNNGSAEQIYKGLGGTLRFYTEGDVTVKNVDIHDNEVRNGGGISFQNIEKVVLDNVDIYSNIATGDPDMPTYNQGVGLYFESVDDVTVKDLTIRDNSGGFLGGGIYLYETTLTLDETVSITGNSSCGGGGVFVDGEDATVELNGALVSGNKASYDSNSKLNNYQIYNGWGAGVYLNGGNLIMNDGEIENNIADYMAGGIMNYQGSLSTFGGSISSNEINDEDGQGEGVYQCGKMYLKGQPMITDEVYLDTVAYTDYNEPLYIGVTGEFTGEPILVDVSRDPEYKEGRDLLVYDTALDAPDYQEIIKYDLEQGIKDDGYNINVDPQNNMILELSTIEPEKPDVDPDDPVVEPEEPSDKPNRPHRPSYDDNPKTDKECANEYGDGWIWSEDHKACIRREWIIVDTSTK